MKTLLIVLSLLNAGDAGTTIHNKQRHGWYERDPLVRPFANLPSPGYSAIVGAGIGAEWELAKIGEHHHHAKLMKAFVLAGIGIEIWAVRNNVQLKGK